MARLEPALAAQVCTADYCHKTITRQSHLLLQALAQLRGETAAELLDAVGGGPMQGWVYERTIGVLDVSRQTNMEGDAVMMRATVCSL